MTNEMPILILLLEYGLEVNPWCVSAFFTAITWGNYETVEFMLAKGLDSNFTVDVLTRAQETYTSSAIGLAIRFGHLDILQLLLQSGASPELCDIELALENGYEEDVALLEEWAHNGFKPKPRLYDHLQEIIRNSEGDGKTKPLPMLLPQIFDPSLT